MYLDLLYLDIKKNNFFTVQEKLFDLSILWMALNEL